MKKNLFIVISSFLTLIIAFSCMTYPVTAAEVGTFEGETHRFRWAWTYVNANGDVTKCRLKLNNDYLTSYWATTYSGSVNHWNTLDEQFGYYEDKVYAYDVLWDNSKCDMFTAPTGHFLYTSSYADDYAATFYKNGSGIWFIDPITGDEGTFTSGTVTYSRIYLKNLSSSHALYNNTNFKRWVMRHEIGHVLGMGHVSSVNIESIMHKYYTERYENDCIYYVTQHDINVLEGFYPNP